MHELAPSTSALIAAFFLCHGAALLAFYVVARREVRQQRAAARRARKAASEAREVSEAVQSQVSDLRHMASMMTLALEVKDPGQQVLWRKTRNHIVKSAATDAMHSGEARKRA